MPGTIVSGVSDGNDTFNENEGTSLAEGGVGTNNGSDLMSAVPGLDDTITYSARSTRVVVYLEPLPQWAAIDDITLCEAAAVRRVRGVQRAVLHR